MNKITAFLAVVLIWTLLAIGVFVGEKHSQSKITNTDTIHSVVYDTVQYRMPIAHDSVVVRYLYRHVTVNDTITDTIVHAGDSIPVVIPVTQKAYRDSSYEAWVSGYEPRLDSINIFNKTIIRSVYKTKRWGLGVNGGYGYTKEGFSPYIGIGIQYNLISW